ncbi:response regulator [Telmatospirillum sp. J64-1]|uniref:response regulator n=1 Tax=Telmatospirillum sp. J64-1 TaxID=2502183 RepID=UPI00115E07E0|nr:response regulator [Telmatospirillum sp. J64-1]
MSEKQHIVIVEDSPTQALRLSLFLERQGYDVTHCATGEAAFDELNRSLPDLVIVDYHLPGIDGADLCRQIRLNVNTIAIPVLMLTADESPAAQRLGLDSGADDFLPKSVHSSLLLLRVRNLLRQSRQQRQHILRLGTGLRRPRALVIGEGRLAQEVIPGLLTEEGCEVLRSTTGKEAVGLLDGLDYVLISHELTDMDWMELCRLTKEAEGDQPPSVLVVVERPIDDDPLAELLSQGADDYVTTATEPATLKARLRAMTRRRFLLEQNRRLLEEFRAKEMEAMRVRAEMEAAAARAALAEELAEANQRLRIQAQITSTITDNATAGLFMLDGEGRPTFMNPAAEAMTGWVLEEIADKPLHDSLHHTLSNGSPSDSASWEVTRSAVEGRPLRDHQDVLIRRNGSHLPVLISVSPLDDGGRAVIEVVDITERVRAQQHQNLLMAELSHRVKNTLATVLSVAAQTRLGNQSLDSFMRTFRGRIQALAATHNLLAERSWSGVELQDVVMAELRPYWDEERGNITLDGPPITLPPKGALSLGMAFHELATNAAKYGALSCPGGRVHVSWRLQDDNQRLSLEWREEGGPPVKPPSRKGFGRMLIEHGLAYELKGKAQLGFRPDGLHCLLDIPVPQPVAQQIVCP